MIRKALVLLAVLLGTSSLAPAAFAQYQPGQPGIVLTPSTTTPLTVVTAIGFGCPKGVAVTLTINGETVATTTSQSDDRGSFQTTFPAPATPGQYTVTATCGNTIMSSVLTVIAAPTTSIISTPLPITGSDSTMPMVRVGLMLVAVGGLILLAVRRRREA